MNKARDPFDVLVVVEGGDQFDALSRKAVSIPPVAPAPVGAVAAHLHAFDVDDAPLISGIPAHPHEIVRARTTVALRGSHVGASVVLVYENGDSRCPIVIGVLEQTGRERPAAGEGESHVSVVADDERIVLSADREIVLRCGDASITLTRAGKVIIQGSYILSRSSGYNKIKGAAVDIN
jgi:hypothetical protein